MISKALSLCVASVVLLNAAVSAPLHLERVLRSIRAADLRGDLSFLASDALQGRYAPSPSLDVAAEFIASQFRAAGLEPGGNQDYFQTASMVDRRVPAASAMSIEQGSRTWTVPREDVRVLEANYAANIDRRPAIVFAARDPDLLNGSELTGKAVIVPVQPRGKISHDQMPAVYNKRRAFDKAVAISGAAVEILVGREGAGQARPRLLSAEEAEEHRPPVVSVAGEELQTWLEHPGSGVDSGTVSLKIPPPEDQRAVLKNVIGVLRGSDPKLKDTFVLLTAHYDHIGTSDTGSDLSTNRTQNPNDHIYNGANDDGSGTVSVIEIGRALARADLHPKRSIVFMTFFGEERGDIGSEYYGAHPMFPIAKTVADVNLEQVGRTDSTIGRQLHNASLTGFDYSDVTKYFEAAGRETGVRVYMDKEASDAYFTRSDNAALAERGVPAHTLCVAYDYSDYHGLGDEWQKIDYDNMAQVDRTVALGLWKIANSAIAPKWNAQNPKTAPFREAQAHNSRQ